MSRPPFDAQFCIPSWWALPLPLPETLTRGQYEAEQRAAAQAPAEPGYAVEPDGTFCGDEE